MTSKVTIEERLHDAKRGVAILVTCLAQEIEEMHPGFAARYSERLAKAYRHVREEDTDALDRLELLNWTQELLTGWSPITGKGKPFME